MNRKNKNIFAIAMILILSITFIGNSFSAPESKLRKINNFSLHDYNKVKHQLNDYDKSKAIVIIFVATQCPVSNAYNERMTQLYESYKEKNIAFIGINSNKQESIEEIKEHASTNKLDFVILKDSNNVIADVFEASFTPEVYVLNNSFEQVYHGRIDDSRKVEGITVNDLKNVLDEILASKKISVNETKAFGCSIKRVR